MPRREVSLSPRRIALPGGVLGAVGAAREVPLEEGVLYELRVTADVVYRAGTEAPQLEDAPVTREVGARFVADARVMQLAAATGTDTMAFLFREAPDADHRR